MEKVTFSEVLKKFRDFNEERGNTYGASKHPKEIISAIVVYKQSNFTKEYTETERSYRITNFDGKMCFNGMLGNSIFGDCLDGKDLRVRLDSYNWEVDFCYFEKKKYYGVKYRKYNGGETEISFFRESGLVIPMDSSSKSKFYEECTFYFELKESALGVFDLLEALDCFTLF